MTWWERLREFFAYHTPAQEDLEFFAPGALLLTIIAAQKPFYSAILWLIDWR